MNDAEDKNKNDIERLQNTVNILQTQLDEMSNSISWRITAPLRKINAVFYKNKNHEKKVDTVEILNFINNIENDGGKIFGKKLLKNNTKKSKFILVYTHELSLTGAPIAVKNLCEVLKKYKKFPILISPTDGLLRQQIIELGMPVIIYSDIYGANVLNNYEMFSCIIVNTVVGSPLINRLNDTNVPVIWWIHECKEFYEIYPKELIPTHTTKNIHIFCCNKYAKMALLEQRPKYKVDILTCSTTDYKNNLFKSSKDKKTRLTFLLIGSQTKRKGWDIALKSLDYLSKKNIFKNCKFIFVGSEIEVSIKKMAYEYQKKYPKNLEFFDNLDVTELRKLHYHTNCLLCPSRDDPAPLVIPEALSAEENIICSKNVGTSKFLEEHRVALILDKNSPKELASKIEYVFNNYAKLKSMRHRSRYVYKKYFSEKTFERQISKIYSTLIKHPYHKKNEYLHPDI